MPSPNVFQGTLNRALVSLSVIQSPELNVTTGFFGLKVARLSFDGAASDYLGTLSGAVPSPRLYQMVTCQFYINKSQSLANLWESRRLTSTSLGDVNVVTDAGTLGSYYLNNCVLMNISELDLTGDSNDFPVSLQGTYQINSSIYN